jgi:hypothetical protein
VLHNDTDIKLSKAWFCRINVGQKGVRFVGWFKANEVINKLLLSIALLKKRIRKHYYNVVKIMSEMIEGNYSKEELNELQQFMLNHPYMKFADELCEKAHHLNPSLF